MNRRMRLCTGFGGAKPAAGFFKLCCAAAFVIALAHVAGAQTAFISDAWWTFQQDCDGDLCFAGTLFGNIARLNWAPAVTNCNGTLTVYEVVSRRACGAGSWTPIYTNAPHGIAGCQSIGRRYLDVPLAGGGACRDYRIEIYRNGAAAPDYVRSSTNDPDLAQHKEELLSEDACASDFFGSCVSLSGNSGSQADNSAYATKEPGEPSHAGNPGGHSLWYCWTAPTNRPVTFDTSGSGFDTLLAVYTGNSLGTLALVANNDDIAGATNRLSKVAFTPVTGMTYHIAVDGFGGGSGLTVLNWNQTGSALPDLIVWGPAVSPNFETATFPSNACEVVEGCISAGVHRLMRFTAETRNIGSGDLIIGDPATNSLFIFASCHGHYHFEEYMQYTLLDTNGNVAAAGTKVGFCILDEHPFSPTANPSSRYDCAYQGLQAGWADVYADSLPCQYIDVTAVPAGDYLLQMIVNPDNLIVEANFDNNVALIPVTITPPDCTSTPSNNTFAAAMNLPPGPSTYSEPNNCATKEPGEPDHAGDAGGHSLWFNWTPVSNHIAVITTKRSVFDTLLGVYTGNPVSGLTLVAANDDIVAGVFLQSQVSFAAVAGTTYRIAVDGWGGAVGAAALNIDPPANDDFAGRFAVSGAAGTTNGFNTNASREPSEPAHAADVGGHSLWYQWTAPISGPVDFNTAGSSFDTTLAIYADATLTMNMQPVAANDDDMEGGGLSTSRASFYAVAGNSYQVAVDGFAGDTGNVVLNWTMNSELQIVPLADGKVKLNLSGVDWQRYVLLGSSNLFEWHTNTAAITMAGGRHDYTNSPATNVVGREFYRAMRVP